MTAVEQPVKTRGPRCHDYGIRGTGNLGSRVMVIGIAPGREEMKIGEPFVGQSGHLFSNILEAVGWSKDQTYCTNLVCYPCENTTDEETLMRAANCHATERLEKEFELVRPRLVVLLGAVVTRWFYSNYKFGEIRGMIDYREDYDAWFMPTYHPAALLRSSKNDDRGDQSANMASHAVNDLAKIAMFFKDNPHPVHTPHVAYNIISTRAEAELMLLSLHPDKRYILDVETNNKEIDVIDPHNDRLLCLALSDGEITWVIPEQLARGLKWPDNVQYGAHYAAFDFQVLLRAGSDLQISHDSLLAHFVLDARSGVHRLKPLTREYCYAGFYERKLASARRASKGEHMGDVDTADLYEYNAKDAAYEARLLNRFLPQIEAQGLTPLYERLIRAANIYKYMHYEGVPVSRERLGQLALKWAPLIAEKELALERKARQLGWNKPNEINTSSTKDLGEFFFDILRLPGLKWSPKTGAASTDKDVLEFLEPIDKSGFITDVIDLRHLQKLNSTYVWGMKDWVRATERVYPTPLLHGTVSGRCSYSNPAINTIPRAQSDSKYGPDLRKLFLAPPGYVILQADFKQAELWCAWMYSKDPQLLADLESGDIHTNNAARIYNIPISEVTGVHRYPAKRTTFGMLYLIGAVKLARQVKRTVEEAEHWLATNKLTYAGYMKWTEDQFRETRDSGLVRTFTGRVHRFPIVLDRSVQRQIINYPIQATAHDYLMESLVEAYWPLRNNYECYTMLDVHDAGIFLARQDNYTQAAKYIKHTFEKPRFGMPYVIPVEISVGASWGEVKEIHV